MSDKPEQRKSLVTTMPAILTGAAALIAAITTSVVNLRGDKDEDASVAAPTTQLAATASAKPVAGNPDHLQLRVARIAVHSDGTAGTTDWRFAVEVADEPRFAFEQDRLTDEGGRNIAVPTHDPTDVVLKPAYLERPDANRMMPTLPGILPVLLDRAVPINHYIPVDFYLPGCPPPASRIKALLLQLLSGNPTGLTGADIKFG